MSSRNGLFDYDLAMYKRLRMLWDETLFASPEEHFVVNAKRHKGKIVLPFIGVWRLPDFNIDREMLNDPGLRGGYTAAKTRSHDVEFPMQRVAMHSLPVTIQYQIDVYAIKRDVCDGITAELMMEFMERPWLSVEQTDMGGRPCEYHLILDDSVTDNSDISSFDETNRFYRLTLTVTVDPAQLLRIDNFKDIDKVSIDYVDFTGDKENWIRLSSEEMDEEDLTLYEASDNS